MDVNWSEIRYGDRPRAAWHLFVEVEDGKRYLVNTAKVGIERLVYSRCAFYNFEGKHVVSSRPIYELKDLPPGAKVYLEDVDPYEDGVVHFQSEEVDWADGPREKGWGMNYSRGLFNGLATKRRPDLIGEIKAASVADLQQQADDLARRYRELDGRIQGTNWTTESSSDGSLMSE